MTYYYDCEFLEGTQKKWFGKTPATIDLISIGMVSGDGRTYYAISKDFNLKEAWNRWEPRTGEGDRNNIEPRKYWIRENVLKPIWKELMIKDGFSSGELGLLSMTYSRLKYLIKKYGKSNKRIAQEIFNFVHQPVLKKWDDKISFIEEIVDYAYKNGEEKHEFYTWYGSYDWVVFCWLWGKMIDLPTGFPMYTRDLRVIFDEKLDSVSREVLLMGAQDRLDKTMLSYSLLKTTKERLLKNHPDYPKQNNEHNALFDAKFNKELHEFLGKI